MINSLIQFIKIGGLDQTVNIHNGYDLIKKYNKTYDNHDVYGLFIPLITDQKGNKIGKSDACGKICYLNPEVTSYLNFFQVFYIFYSNIF